MIAKLLGLRPEDRRDTLVAFITLSGVMGGHSILETARDALFLAKLPAAQLPWAYLAIAVTALAVSALNGRVLRHRSKRRALQITLLGGAAVTGALYAALADPDARALFALYVWSGVFATVVVVQFWLLLAEALDVGQAKRAFAVIGAGGLGGAALGSAAAGLVARLVDARALVVLAAGLFAAASFVPMAFTVQTKREDRKRRSREGDEQDAWTAMRGDPYLERLFTVVVVSTLVFTGVDFVFKTAVAESVRAPDLGTWFAVYYACVNTAGIVVQLVVAPRLVRGLGVTGAVLVLPSLMLVGIGGALLVAGLVPLAALRAVDATLRHSVHRTATEILHFPLEAKVRERFRAFTEAVGQRGGQAVASLLILGALAFGAQAAEILAALLGLAALWLAASFKVRPLYVDRFRRQLRGGRSFGEVEAPELDLKGLETLLAALSSENDDEVIAALEMFEQHGKQELIPALVLYHPSREVVLRALQLLEGQNRSDVMRLSSRLVTHDEPEIRAAALHLSASLEPDIDRLRELESAECEHVRVAARVELVNAGAIDADAAHAWAEEIVAKGDYPLRLAFARAFRHLDPVEYGEIADELVDLGIPDLSVEVARSAALKPHVRYLPALVRLLERRVTRTEARAALLALGDAALVYLDRCLADPSLPSSVRAHLPRSISRFPGKKPALVLMNRLPHERDEGVALKILRGVGRMRADDPSIPIDRAALVRYAQKTAEYAVRLLDWRLAIAGMRERREDARTDASELLMDLLREKESAALERIFRTLGTIKPMEEFRMIYAALASKDPKARAGSRELLQHVLPPDLPRAVLALVDDAPDHERLASALAFHEPAGARARIDLTSRWQGASGAARAPIDEELVKSYSARLGEMLAESTGVLRSLASYHIAELRLEELRKQVEDAATDHFTGASVLDTLHEGAIGLFARPGVLHAG